MIKCGLLLTRGLQFTAVACVLTNLFGSVVDANFDFPFVFRDEHIHCPAAGD